MFLLARLSLGFCRRTSQQLHNQQLTHQSESECAKARNIKPGGFPSLTTLLRTQARQLPAQMHLSTDKIHKKHQYNGQHNISGKSKRRTLEALSQ
jgi:hypothetical protein